MRIGYDAKRIVSNGTGLGSYGRTLINSLAALEGDDELLLYAPDEGRKEWREQVRLREGVRFVYSDRKHGMGKSLWRSHGIVEDLRRDGVSLYHGLSGELPVGLRKAGIPGIVTIHDLIFMRHPEYYHAIDAWIYKRKFYQTLREADRIIAISERTRQDIIDLGGFPSDRIDLVYQSCDTRYRLLRSEDELQKIHAEYDLPPRYILNVGTVEERKNVLLAVKALEKLPADLSLIIVGRQTKYAEKVKRYIRRHQLDQRVRFLQGVPNSVLPAIYQMAEAFVYPSRYEGFGIPVIEAIQSVLPGGGGRPRQLLCGSRRQRGPTRSYPQGHRPARPPRAQSAGVYPPFREWRRGTTGPRLLSKNGSDVEAVTTFAWMIDNQ